MPGRLGVINSEARALFGPTSTVIIKPCRKEEATILAQLIAHQTLLHSGADRTRAGGTSPGKWVGGVGMLRIRRWRFCGDAANCPVCWRGSGGPGRYLHQIDRLFFYTPCNRCTAITLFLPKRRRGEVLLMVWSRVFQVAVLCDMHGLLLLPAAGRHLFCDWYEGMVGRTAICISRYSLFTKWRLELYLHTVVGHNYNLKSILINTFLVKY